MRRDDPVPSTVDQVRHHLVGLKMPRALEILDHIMRQLERGEIGALEAIDALLGEELTLREGRRVKAALKMGRLASIKTQAGFDFTFQPSLAARWRRRDGRRGHPIRRSRGLTSGSSRRARSGH